MLNLRLPLRFLGNSITSSRYMQSPAELSNTSDTEMLKWRLSRIKYLITLLGLITCTFFKLNLACICTFITVRNEVIFSHTSVGHSVHRGVSASVHAGIHTYPPPADTPRSTPPGSTPPGKHNLSEAHPPEAHPPGSTPPSRKHTPRRSLQRTVRILLECFFVSFRLTMLI